MSNLDLTGKKLPYLHIETRHIAYQIIDLDGYESIGHFYFRYYLDKKFHVYLIPLTDVELTAEGRIISAKVGYTVEDVVMAASGNEQKRQKIENCIAMLRGKFVDNTFMNKSWQADAYADARADFIALANKNRADRYGFPPIPDSQFPLRPTLYTDLTPEEVAELCVMAREAKK